jgi:predicted unusual protein kinase regulating ubiquinone biosynthesis (AarF/ABC1/UbiB family)
MVGSVSQSRIEKLYEEANLLYDHVRRYYRASYDNHDGNFGINSKGNVVCIDFGPLSFS